MLYCSSSSFVNFVGTVGSPQCFTQFDYVDRLMLVTLSPLAVACLLVLVGFTHSRIAPPDRRHDIFRRYVSCFLILTYLVLPSVSTVAFGVFTCTSIDPSGVDPGLPRYMRNDYAIACDSQRYRFGVIWAVVSILVYPVGITSFYLAVLYVNRDTIVNKDDHQPPSLDLHPPSSVHLRPSSALDVGGRAQADLDAVARAGSSVEEGASTAGGKAICTSSSSVVWVFFRSLGGEIEFLHRSYVGRLWYWEVVETVRRLMLTAVLSVVAVGSSAQAVFGIFIALVFMKVRLAYARTLCILVFSLLTCRLCLLVFEGVCVLFAVSGYEGQRAARARTGPGERRV